MYILYITVILQLLYQSRAYKRGELSTDHNLSYGQNASQYRRTDSKGEYEIPDYIIPSSAPPVQEAVYEGVN